MNRILGRVSAVNWNHRAGATYHITTLAKAFAVREADLSLAPTLEKVEGNYMYYATTDGKVKFTCQTENVQEIEHSLTYYTRLFPNEVDAMKDAVNNLAKQVIGLNDRKEKLVAQIQDKSKPKFTIGDKVTLVGGLGTVREVTGVWRDQQTRAIQYTLLGEHGSIQKPEDQLEGV